MAYKTAAELFGDGGVWGVQVPIDFGPPAGVYDPTNRGIGFGEQLTSAIANRSHWALAENTDDLNTRLAVFETGGLDAAYRGGALATPGSGADITLDGKAVNTVSANTAVYALDESNAHFRADMTADTSPVGIGMEVRGRGLGGVVHLQQLDSLSQDSLLSGTGLAAVLNPGGALPTTVRVTGQQPHISGATDLLLDHDFLFVDDGTNRRLYLVSGLGGVDTDVTVTDVTGGSPVFVANQAATVTFYRANFGSFNGLSGRAGLRGALLASGGRADTDAVLDLVGARSATDTSMQDAALRTRRRASDGTLSTSLTETSLGRNSRSISVAGFETAVSGQFGTIAEVASSKIDNDGGASPDSYVTVDWDQGRYGFFPQNVAHLDLKSHRIFDEAAVLAATVFSADTFQLVVPLNPFQQALLPSAGSIVEVVTSSDSSLVGKKFWVVNHDTANDRFTVANISGSTAVSLTLAATVDLRVHALLHGFSQSDAGIFYGGVSLGTLSNPADGIFGNDTIAWKELSARGTRVFYDAALELWGSFGPVGTEGIEKIVEVDSLYGNINTKGSVAALGGDGVSTQYANGFKFVDPTTGFSTTKTVTKVYSFANALPDYFGGATEWNLVNRTFAAFTGPLESAANNSVLVMPLRLPDGAEDPTVDVRIQMGATRALAGDRLRCALYLIDKSGTVTNVGFTGTAANNTLSQVVSLSWTGTLNADEDELMLAIYSGDDGGAHQPDQFWTATVTWEDPGPRNF